MRLARGARRDVARQAARGSGHRESLADTRWPGTVEGVILQPWQFSSFNKNDPNVSLYPAENDPSWSDCVAAADDVLSSAAPLTPANHYHVVGLDPAWRDDQKIVASVDT